MNHRIVFLALAAVCLGACGSSNKSDNQPANQSAQQQAAPAPDSTTSAPAAPKPTPPPEPPKPVVIPAGTEIDVVLDQALGSKSSTTGDSFSTTVQDAVTVDGKVVIPKSAIAKGTVVEAKAKGKVKGEARLKLALTSIVIKGETYSIETSMMEQTAKGKGKRTAATTGGGAAIGALIGGIAGGGKGAAIGAGVGAGAGFVGGAFTGNKQIELPAETPLSFELTRPITLK